MGMLNRYRKPGGFEQLLALIESCTEQKREQLLKLIHQEDPGWGALLKTKMLTLEKIFSWDNLVVAEITPTIPPRTLAIALHSLPEGSLEKAVYAMDSFRKREIESFFEDLHPGSGEIEAARIKVVTTVRDLEKEGKIDLLRIDPAVSLKAEKAA